MNLFRPRRFADGDQVEVAGVQVRLRISARARRVSLRLDAARREMIATAPDARRLADAAAFALERSDWIADRLAELPKARPIRAGDVIEVLGRPCLLESASGRTRWREPDAQRPQGLIANGEGDAYSRTVIRALKSRALNVLRERTYIHAEALGQPAPVVAVMDARARWGSCTPPRRVGFAAAAGVGRIRYSWRLVLAPHDIMDYVVAHECAHLVEANHSPRFWAVVHGLVGDHRPYRAWLREHGARLHAFGR